MRKQTVILPVLRNVICGILLFLFSAALTAEIVKLLRDMQIVKLEGAAAFTLAASIYSFIQIATFTVWFKRQNKKQANYVWTKPISAANILRIPSLSFFLLFVSALLTQLVHFLAKFSTLFKDVLQDYNATVLQQLNPLQPLTILAIVILVPMAEELLFRAFLVGELKRVLPVNWACVCSAVIFSIAHWNVLQSAYTFVAGLALAFIYAWTESIYFTIALHACFNLCGSVFPYILLRYPQFEIPYVLLMIVLAISGYFAIGALYRQNIVKNEAKLAIDTNIDSENCAG